MLGDGYVEAVAWMYVEAMRSKRKKRDEENRKPLFALETEGEAKGRTMQCFQLCMPETLKVYSRVLVAKRQDSLECVRVGEEAVRCLDTLCLWLSVGISSANGDVLVISSVGRDCPSTLCPNCGLATVTVQPKTAQVVLGLFKSRLSYGAFFV